MPNFQYSFNTGKGRKKNAFIEAINLNEAKERLRQQGLIVFSIKEVTERRRVFWHRSQTELKPAQLATFTTQLAQLLHAKIPLYECLVSLTEQNKQEKFSSILTSLCEQIKTGSSLSQAMQRFPLSFSTLYCAMVAAGESIGALDTALERLSETLNKQLKLKKQITTALIYPSLLCSFSLFLIVILFTFVVPSLQAIFEDQHVNRFTQLVFACSSFITKKWFFYLPVLISAVLTAFWFFKKPKGKLWKQKAYLHLPIIKILTVQSALARFSRTMGSLLQGGVPVMKALQIGRSVMNNQVLETIVEEAERRIVEGSMLSKELSRSKLIPHLVIRMLAIGEESGTLPNMLLKIAELYEADIEKNVTRLTALAQPVILLAMGGLVGIIMLAVLLPLTDISAFMNSS